MNNEVKIRECLKKALRIRMVEEKVAAEYPLGQIRCPTHLSIGQELNASLICEGLSEVDLSISTHRSHAHYLAKGGSLKRFIAELYGLSEGCSKGYGGSMHLIDTTVGFMGSTAIVGNSIPIGVGLGIAVAMEGQGRVATIFFGEAATEQGVFFESLNLAKLKQANCLFVCEDNIYSVYTPKESRIDPSRSLEGIVSSFGIPFKRLDVAKIEKSLSEIEDSIKMIRSGYGPQFISIPTYRYLEHCGPRTDDHLGYRSPDEVEKAKKMDSLSANLEIYFSYSELQIIKESYAREIDRVFEECKMSPELESLHFAG